MSGIELPDLGNDDPTSFLANVSCLTTFSLPYELRCEMTKRVPHCDIMSNLVRYIEMIHCMPYGMRWDVSVAIDLLFIIFIALNMLVTGKITYSYLTPIMRFISRKLHMSEYLSGITLVAFVNELPDIFSNMLSIRQRSALFSKTIASCLIGVLFCGGNVCFMKPFEMDGNAIVRDVLFLLLGVEVLAYLIADGSHVSRMDCCLIFLLYLFYLIIQGTDIFLVHKTIKTLRKEITDLKQQPHSSQREDELKIKLSRVIELEMQAYVDEKNEEEDMEKIMTNRYILYDTKNSNNQFLLSDFFENINPIESTNWKLGGFRLRTFYLLTTPIYLLIKLLIPHIDPFFYKHSWSKLLNCLQIVISPFFVITIIHSCIANEYIGCIIHIKTNISIWTLLLTVPLALYVFSTTRTDTPPSMHAMFMIITIPTAFTILLMCTLEIEILCDILGAALGLNGEFMDITFSGLTKAGMDMIVLYNMTVEGYEKMAFAAVYAGPFVCIVTNLGIPLLFNRSMREKGSDTVLFGVHGETCHLFFWMTIITTLLWTSTFNFKSRRSYAIYAWILLSLFFLFSILIEFNFVHSFASDPIFIV